MWEHYKGSLYMSTFDSSTFMQSPAPAPALAVPVFGFSQETIDLVKPVADLNHAVLGGGDVWRLAGDIRRISSARHRWRVGDRRHGGCLERIEPRIQHPHFMPRLAREQERDDGDQRGDETEIVEHR